MSLSSDGTVMTMPVQPANANSNGGGFGWGDNGALWLIVLFLFIFAGGWGNGNGWGNNAGNGAGVVDGYVLTSDFANIERKIDNVNNGLCDGFYQQAQLINGVQQGMSNGFMSAEIQPRQPASSVHAAAQRDADAAGQLLLRDPLGNPGSELQPGHAGMRDTAEHQHWHTRHHRQPEC